MRDPYEVLGVSRTATQAEIKSAFRKLAKTSHPDQNKADPKAQERFAELNAAYEIVGDKEKRGQFDRGEIDAEGKPRFQGFEGFGRGPGAGTGPGAGGSRTFRWSTSGADGDPFAEDDILNEILGGLGRGRARPGAGPGPGARPRPIRGEDVTAKVAVTLEQYVRGDKARVGLPTGQTVDVAIPPGTKSGQTIRLKGQGKPGLLGGPAGDALITVEFVPHPFFRVEGDTLRRDVSVSLDEAVLGGKIKVPTLDGDVSMSVPPWSSGGKTLRLKGRGLPRAGGRGDLLVSLRILLPEKPDLELEALMKRWGETKGYDVRDSESESA